MVGGGSQRLLSPNPTTVMVVLLLGLWRLLGCDNKEIIIVQESWNIEGAGQHQSWMLIKDQYLTYLMIVFRLKKIIQN